MSDQETSDSDSNDSCENSSEQKALPYPETSVELASKVFSKETDVPSHPRTPPPSPPDKNNALPWHQDPKNKNSPKEINILLLGESGVGKSTFINSFANYMKHENFEAVQQNNLSVLIPARFHIFDKELQKHLIEIGANDTNEHLADGAAATQDVKTYVFYVAIENESYQIRLIDTPGMGDPRGIDQDNKNCDYVLSYLARLEKVHAICLLLRPTNTRLDVFLNYCITQILSRLDRSATDNISFVFTNTRGQNYTPGDTYTSLEVLVKKIKDTNNVVLPLSKKNVFCFDNEAFRFLAAVKQGVEFKEGILEANIESWKYSYKEVYRLLSYITELKPHDPKKTISINHARKMVLQLAQPLAEIVQLIGDNIYELDQHTNQLLMENQTLEQLKQKLHMPVIDIIVKELAQPVTVCTAPHCSAIYKVAGKNKFHYKQRCHNPCYLNNVPAEIVGDPHILDCWAITRSNQTCHECGCRFNTHMHIYYETETFENKIVDENVLKNINSKEDAAKEKQRIINKILNHKEDLEKEHKYIIKCTAAFAHFLQKNAITPINDSLKEYVKYLITREENLGPSCNRATLDYLRKLLAEYEQEKSVLEEALTYDSATNGAFDNSPNAIERKIRELFTLRNFGAKIKQLYDLHQTGGLTEHKQTEFIVKEMYKLTLVDKVKSLGGSFMNAIGFGNSNKKTQKEETRYEIEQRRNYRGMPRMHRQQYSESQAQNGSYYFGPPSSFKHFQSHHYDYYPEGYENDGYNLYEQQQVEQFLRQLRQGDARLYFDHQQRGQFNPEDNKGAYKFRNDNVNGAESQNTTRRNARNKGQKAIQSAEIRGEDSENSNNETNSTKNTGKGKNNKKNNKKKNK